MVYTNTVKYNIPEGAYGNEVWRQRHGYKEEHQHDAPMRRNRDFKPVPYGSFGGMPNYRHAEPWCQLKNIRDLGNEHSHFPTVWAKQFLFGATVGVVLGQGWFFIKPSNSFAIQKLMAATGDKPFTGRTLRLFRHVAPSHGLFGGSIALGYHLVFEFLRHHDETNLRPMFIDHTIAMTLIGAFAAAALVSGSPKHMITGAIFSGLTISPVLWWLKIMGNKPGQMNTPANIFYLDDCTKEEIDRFRHQD